VPNQPPESVGTTVEKVTPTGAIPRIPLGLLTLAAGMLAGLLSWLGGEVTLTAFPPVAVKMGPEYAGVGGYERAGVRAMLEGQAQRAADRKKTAAAYGLLGALLGVALGLTGGLSRGSLRSGMGSAVVGGLAAAVVGAVLAWVLVPAFYQLQESSQVAQYSHPDEPSRLFLIHFLIHAGITAGIGLAAGVGLGWGLGDRVSLGGALIGGLFGALAGTFLFETINSVAFPLMRAESLMPEDRIPRLAMHLGVAAGTAFLAGLAAAPRRHRSASTPLAR
jgi:hypothetical protein